MSDAADLQTDLELSATETDAASAAAREIQKNIHTQLPGIIRSYDPDTQTASVQPAIKRIWIENGGVDLPPCLDVPVHFARGGGFVLTLPVAKDDECLLCFSERAIDFWFANGGTQLPSEYRLHDYSDAFAFIGFSSRPNAIKNVATDAAELRTLDGQTLFRLEAGAAIVGADVAAEFALKGESYRQAQAAMNKALAAALAALAGASTGPLGALQAQFTAAANAVTLFEATASGAGNFLATKAKVG